jgi:molecular chaperone GrpE
MSDQDAADPGEAAESTADREDDAAESTSDGSDSVEEDTSADEPAGDAERVAESSVDKEAELDGEIDEELVQRVAESDPESVARELAALRTRVDALEGQLQAREAEAEELESKLKRKQADFQNFKKRMEKRREQERQRATEDLVERLIDVRDNLVRALDQDEDADIRGGVETTLRVFDDAFDAENVDVVEPEAGTEVDPHRHEVLARVESDAPDGTIADVHRAGYVMADKVLRPAQVTVSEGSESGESEEADEAGSEA